MKVPIQLHVSTATNEQQFQVAGKLRNMVVLIHAIHKLDALLLLPVRNLQK